MKYRITKDTVFEALHSGCSVAGNLAITLLGDVLNEIGQEAFAEAIEIGITNTIASLHAANVDDQVILRVVNEQWGLDIREIEERLVWEKAQSTIRVLQQHLKLQGYSDREIERFMRESSAAYKIRHNHEFWGLKKNPQKLMTAVQKK